MRSQGIDKVVVVDMFDAIVGCIIVMQWDILYFVLGDVCDMAMDEEVIGWVGEC